MENYLYSCLDPPQPIQKLLKCWRPRSCTLWYFWDQFPECQRQVLLANQLILLDCSPRRPCWRPLPSIVTTPSLLWVLTCSDLVNPSPRTPSNLFLGTICYWHQFPLLFNLPVALLCNFVRGPASVHRRNPSILYIISIHAAPRQGPPAPSLQGVICSSCCWCCCCCCCCCCGGSWSNILGQKRPKTLYFARFLCL